MLNNKYDFKEYDNLEDFIDYDGFITPNGTFYKVRPSNMKDDENAPHHSGWALGYLISQNKIDKNVLKDQTDEELLNIERDALMQLIFGYNFYPYAYYRDNISYLEERNFQRINGLNDNQFHLFQDIMERRQELEDIIK
jgi:hypothetical protein